MMQHNQSIAPKKHKKTAHISNQDPGQRHRKILRKNNVAAMATTWPIVSPH